MGCGASSAQASEQPPPPAPNTPPAPPQSSAQSAPSGLPPDAMKRRPSLGISVRSVSDSGVTSVNKQPSFAVGQNAAMAMRRCSRSFTLRPTTTSPENTDRNLLFFGTIDAFGPFGEQVASFMRMHLRNYFQTELRALVDAISNVADKAEELLRSGLADLSERLAAGEAGPSVSLVESGASATVVFFTCAERMLVVGSIGDSRLCVLKRGGDELQQVSAEHSWTSVPERKRAEDAGAEVRTPTIDNVGDVGRPAVFAPNSNRPGLTMSRVFGFTSAKDVGVINEVEFRRLACPRPNEAGIDDGDTVQVVVLATQGLWHVMSDEDVAKLLRKSRPAAEHAADYIDAQQIAQLLMSNAADKWAEQWTDHAIEVQTFFPDLFEANGFVPRSGTFSSGDTIKEDEERTEELPG